MSTSKKVPNKSVVIWIENPDPNDFAYEHAIVVAPYSETINIEQNGNTITVPRYALRDLIKALREMEKEAR